MKIYWTTTEVAQLMDETNVRKVRRWLKEAEALIRRPGAKWQLVMPLDRLQSIYPDLWDQYCRENEIWDSPIACPHAQEDEIRFVDHWWCRHCGGITMNRGESWRLPSRHATALQPNDALQVAR